MRLYIHDIAALFDARFLSIPHTCEIIVLFTACDVFVLPIACGIFILTHFAPLPIILGIRSITAIYVTYVLAHVAASYKTRILNISYTSDVIAVPIAHISDMLIHA